jgi:hypothetical protein
MLVFCAVVEVTETDVGVQLEKPYPEGGDAYNR